MLKKIFSFLNLDYQSTVEAYIKSRNPQTNADIERLEREFQRLSCSAYF